MTLFITLVLTIAAFIFIIYPFFRHKLASTDPSGDEILDELRSERDTTYSMLKELEFDYQSGILTEDDYKDLEARYKRKAISTLRQLDEAARSDNSDADSASEDEDEIEKQVRKLRGQAKKESAAAKPSGATKPAATAETGSTAKSKFCTECGAQAEDEDKFCSNCGSKLN